MPLTQKQTTAPTAFPLTLSEAKQHLALDHTADDALVTSLIAAATGYAAELTGLSFITQSWTRWLDQFPMCASGLIELHRGPVQSVTSVKYYDADNVQQTLSAALYDTDLKSIPARLVPATGEYWPDTYDRKNAVEIVYVTGYGAAGSSVPAEIRHALLLIVGEWYKNRENTVPGSVQPVPLAAERLLGLHRVFPL